MAKRIRVLSSRAVYEGLVVGVKVDRVIEPGGVEATREVVTHGGSVVVLPILDDGRVVLIRQFRYATGKSLWELVAGGIEPGETPRAAARRELREETGYLARHTRLVLTFYASPGFLTERMYLVLARGLKAGEAMPEADEQIEARRFTRKELRLMVERKRIEDAKTLVGVMWLLGGFERKQH